MGYYSISRGFGAIKNAMESESQFIPAVVKDVPASEIGNLSTPNTPKASNPSKAQGKSKTEKVISKGESLSTQEMENIYNMFKSGSPQGKKERSDFLNEVSKHTSVDGFHQFVDQMFTHYTREGGPFDSKKDTLKGEPNIFRTAGAETFNKDLIVHEAKINGFKATISMDNGNFGAGSFDATVSEMPPRALAHFARFQDFVKANKDGPESVAETFARNLSFVACNNVLIEEAEKAGLLTHI
ncbi:MAG: hypothetical protein MRQ13_03055 [Candidatus Midichloria sp.]|nr:hypothetical protein [Candidatus Midichloria sp.]